APGHAGPVLGLAPPETGAPRGGAQPGRSTGSRRENRRGIHGLMMLDESLKLLEQYSVLILPALVIAEQVGIPLPAVPALLAVGALAASGRTSIPLVLGAIALVALTGDLGWSV